MIAVFFVLGILVFRSFWEKAKTEPLTVSEQYWIESLPYSYGSEVLETTRKEEFSLPKESISPSVTPPGQLPPSRDKKKGK